MKININKIEFEIEAVPAALRGLILSDPIIAQGIWRDVWSWDAPSQKGTALTRLTADRAAPLGNGIAFLVTRVWPDGTVRRADAPSKKMAERMMKVTGAKTMTDLMAALNRVIHLPQKTLPLEAFQPLNIVASYKVKMYVDYAVVTLNNPARNLQCYLLIPSQVAFHHEVTAIPDQAAYDAALAANPALSAIQPAFIVPPKTKANLGLRMMACAKAVEELQAEMRAAGGPEATSEAQRLRAGVLAAEWRLLQGTAQAQQQQAAPRPA